MLITTVPLLTESRDATASGVKGSVLEIGNWFAGGAAAGLFCHSGMETVMLHGTTRMTTTNQYDYLNRVQSVWSLNTQVRRGEDSAWPHRCGRKRR